MQSGIGEGLAHDLVSKGWTVACLDVQKTAGEALVADLNRDGPGKAAFIYCDITNYDQQARAYQEVWDRYGRLDALLANAGIIDQSSVYILNHRGKREYVSLWPTQRMRPREIIVT
jgi:NAD(P)-dependent dehydrogenase (short-subunit alcohol dehydrogenase family)